MSQVIVISLVEKSWAGARTLSLAWVRQGICVEHLVKGKLSRDVKQCITPVAGTSIHGIDRRIYRSATFGWLLLACFRNRIVAVLVDNERTAIWVKRTLHLLSDRLLVIHEQVNGLPAIVSAGKAVPSALCETSQFIK